MKYIKIIIFSLFIILCNSVGNIKAQSVSDYLILQDIGDYKFITESKDFITGRPKTIPGYTKRNSPGILAGADHFDLDHGDITYETDYSNRNIKLGVEVQVTQHAGADSDRWLLHEVEDGYRSSDAERLGLVIKGARLREINGNKFISLRGSGYSWISNNVVVEISYTDLSGSKPEPLEIIQAYLQKFPSTISSTLVLNKTHNEQWIKDEMERRLWLCDKWFLQLQLGKADLYPTLKTIVDHMAVFLNYREKYYGISGKDDGLALMGFLSAKDGVSIKNKVAEYKIWWNVNKGRSMNLP